MLIAKKSEKEVHIEVASEPEFTVPNEGRSQSAMEMLPANFQLDSTVEPVIDQLDIPDAGESDRTAEVEPQIIPAIIEEIPAQMEEGPVEDVPTSSTKESENTAQLEPEVDLVASAGEETSAITQVAAEDQIESEIVISQSSSETIPIPEDVTAPVAIVEEQIIGPVEVRSEHAAVVETSSTDGLAGVDLPPDVEESPETLTSLVEPSYTVSDDDVKGVSVLPLFNASQKLKLTF